MQDQGHVAVRGFGKGRVLDRFAADRGGTIVGVLRAGAVCGLFQAKFGFLEVMSPPSIAEAMDQSNRCGCLSVVCRLHARRLLRRVSDVACKGRRTMGMHNDGGGDAQTMLVTYKGARYW